MRPRQSTASRPQGSRPLALLFLLVVVPPTIALLWLGYRLVQQDRSLWTQREAERRQLGLQGVVQSLEQRLSDAERHVKDGPVPAGMVRFTLLPAAIDATPRDRVLWLPAPPPLASMDDRTFMSAEAAEFRPDGAEQALGLYIQAARSTVPAVRAGALVRVARIQRRRKDWNAALTTYRELVAMTNVAFNGMPVDLLARRQICSLLEETQDARVATEAEALEHDLVAGRWALDRAAWDLAIDDVERWTARHVAPLADRRLLSTAAESLWAQRPQLFEQMATTTRMVMAIDGVSVTLLVERATDSAGPSVLAILPSVLDAWVKASGPRDEPSGVTLLATNGSLVAGQTSLADAPGAVSKRPAETGLPWIVRYAPPAASNDTAQVATRWRLLGAALAVLVLLLTGASYALWRVMQRELRVARLQSEFVAAVSHEFRTPLTSLRHVTELLMENDELPRARRATFYAALSRNTDRLQRLVESLLDFARMEDGRKPYQLRATDVAVLVRRVVDEFRQELHGEARVIEYEIPAVDGVARMDESSFTFALWNLLDNAVKYSTPSTVVQVRTELRDSAVAIAVADRGMGIPKREHREIFERFVRGERAARLGIKGTGLGLAMVSHIVKAHGGTIELESTEGSGSIFTIVLPLAAPVESATLGVRPSSSNSPPAPVSPQPSPLSPQA